MGYNDHIHDGRVDLPPEAEKGGRPFDPDDDWLRNASAEQQNEAMKRWFLARFCDPAEDLPYNGREGGFQFVNGGPYDPNDELQDRFGQVVECPVIERLVYELYQMVGQEWTPIDWDETYWDDALYQSVDSRDEAFGMLEMRLAEITEVLQVSASTPANGLIVNMSHGAAITALETYLWDTVSYWTTENPDVFRKFVSTNKSEFGEKKLKVSEIFSIAEELNGTFRKHLQKLVWHRLDTVKPMMEEGFGIELPQINELMEQVVIRNDIVHRGGKSVDGKEVEVREGDVSRLMEMVRNFAADIERSLARTYPARTNELTDF